MFVYFLTSLTIVRECVRTGADLWNINFCTHRFWLIKFQKILPCSVAEIIRHETKHTYSRDIKHSFTNSKFFSRFRFAQKATIVLKSTMCGLKTSKWQPFSKSAFETCFSLKMTKSLKLLKNEATLCPFMIACFKFYSNPWILWRLIFYYF